MTTTSRGPSRRTLVKGAAWSVPVVAMAQPAMAVVCSPNDPSCDPPVMPSVGQNSCKHTEGVKRYHIELIFTNTQRCETNVTITYFAVNPNSGQDVPFVGVDTQFTIPAQTGGTPGTVWWEYDSEVVGNMANGTVDVLYNYTDCNGNVVEEQASINVSSLPPCDFPYPHDGSGTAEQPAAEDLTVEKPAVETTEPVTEVETTQPVTDTETTDVQQGTDNASTTSAP